MVEVISNDCISSSADRSEPATFPEGANGSAHLLPSLTCPGAAVAEQTKARPQIQTYQIRPEQPASTTSSSASELLNQGKPEGTTGHYSQPWFTECNHLFC